MTDLVTIEEAQLSLRLGSTLDETDAADLALAITLASELYLQDHPEADWGDTSPDTLPAPGNIKAGVLTILHSLWDRRGEDPMEKARGVLRLNRGPAVA